jgi:hypothetical protein
MAKILAVTTSLGTRWEAYSQTLLKFIVPEWHRLIIDGRRDWSPIGFISKAINYDVDYIVYIDEDCFVQSRDALLSLIEIFEQNRQIVAAGIPDGGYYYRDYNPAALNLFFVVFRASALKEAWKKIDLWNQLHFNEGFVDEVMRQCPDLDQGRINWDKAEPYYPLFWSLLSAGSRFLYLKEDLFKARWSTRVFSPSGEVVAEHMWYLRQWFSHQIMPGHDCPNLKRYEHLQADLLLRHGANLKFRSVLNYMHVKRFLRRYLE